MWQARSGITASVVSALCVSANAADLRPAYKAPPSASAPYSWSGFYVGGNVGGAWGDLNNALSIANNSYFVGGAIPGVNTSGTFGGTPGSFTGGGQIGWNYQTGFWVWGVEADFNWLDLEASRFGPFAYTTNGAPYNLNSSLSVNWLATIRGRLGYAVDRNLFYVTGGLALADLQFDQFFSEPPFAPTPMTISSSKVRTGWTVGGGYEFAWISNWTTKIEYMFSRFTEDYAGVLSPGVTTFNNSADFDLHVVRVGLNYKWDWGKTPVSPVVARY